MNKLLIGALLAPFLSYGQLVPVDKQKHFVVGSIVSLTTHNVVKTKTNNKFKASMYGLGAAFVVGGVKEVLDQKQPDNKFDVADWYATVLGGATVNLTINIFDNK